MTGLRAWLVQRLSAVYMLGFIPFALLHFLFDPPHSFETWRNWVSATEVTIAIAGFFVALIAHAWVGLRDVMMDYISSIALRAASLALLAIVLLAILVWAFAILVRAF